MSSVPPRGPGLLHADAHEIRRTHLLSWPQNRGREVESRLPGRRSDRDRGGGAIEPAGVADAARPRPRSVRSSTQGGTCGVRSQTVAWAFAACSDLAGKIRSRSVGAGAAPARTPGRAGMKGDMRGGRGTTPEPLVLHVIPTRVARGAQREARALADRLTPPVSGVIGSFPW